jgi:hypothetical protein
MPQPASRLVRPMRAVLAICLLVVAPLPAAAQNSKSAAAAKELSDTLDQLKLDSIAASDPSDPNTFVAALYFQGAQLLVVSAKYSAPTLLVDKLKKKEYRDTYIDLNAASMAGTKIFIMDQGANGLVPRPESDQPADTWEQGDKTTAFDGDWKKANVSEEEYAKRFSNADEQYARMLSLLTAQAKQSGS